MASNHFKVSIVKSSANQSAVAAAAYQSGSRLYRDADGKKRTACISNDTPASKKNNKPKNTKTR